MKYANVNVLSGSDASSINGAQIDANQLISSSFMIYFGDATAAGTVKIQASNDVCAYGNLAQDFTVTNWVDIPNATVTIASGASALITIPQMAYRWIRPVYTRSGGGSSTINVVMFALSV